MRPRQDLNLRPEAPEASTLSAELRGREKGEILYVSAPARQRKKRDMRPIPQSPEK